MARFTLSLLALLLGVAILPDALSANKYRKGGNKAIDPPDSGEDGHDDEEEVWLFHLGPADSREEYVDLLTGEVRGYHVDVLNAVCAIAEKNCQTVYDLSKNCFDNVDGVPVGGVGLFNFYYDCCTAWTPTYTRMRTFQFSKSFNLNRGSGFAVRAGNRGRFDPTNLTGKRIGFIQGFFADPSCLARQADEITGADLAADQIVYFPGVVELKEAVLSGRGVDAIDAAFDWQTNYNNDARFDFLNEDAPIECATGGPAMMCRKDNTLPEWFNPALCELLASTDYQEICDNIDTVHGEKPGPDSAGVCVDVADVCGDEYETATVAAVETTEEPAR